MTQCQRSRSHDDKLMDMRKLSALWGAAGLLLLTGCGTSGPDALGVPTVLQTVGTCHYPRTEEEFLGPSDVAPPVRCDRPHRTETFKLVTVEGPLAASAERPQPELLQDYMKNRCGHEELREYLGAGPRDTVNFSVLSKYPTRKEWAIGIRVVRCDALAPTPESKIGPLTDLPGRDVLKKRESAAVRHCELDGKAVTCDKPHDVEEVNAWLDLGKGPYPTDIGAAVARVCQPFVEEFLGRRMQYTPGLVIKARTPSPQDWEGGNRTVKCGVGPAGADATLSGTLSANAREL